MLDLAALGGFLVVVALNDRATERADDFQALARVGVVADDVANADGVGDSLRLHILQYGLEGFEVTVDVSKNAKSHAYRPTRNASGMLNPKDTALIGKDSFFFWDRKFVLQFADFLLDPVRFVKLLRPFLGRQPLP